MQVVECVLLEALIVFDWEAEIEVGWEVEIELVHVVELVDWARILMAVMEKYFEQD